MFEMFRVETAGWLMSEFPSLCSRQVRKNNRESVYPSRDVLLIFKWFLKYFPKYFLICWRLNNSKFLISQKIRKSLLYFRAYVGRFMIKYGGAPPTKSGWISQYLSKCLQQFIKYTPARIGPSLAISIKLGLITHYWEFHNDTLNYKLTEEGWGWEYVHQIGTDNADTTFYIISTVFISLERSAFWLTRADRTSY